MGGEPRLAADGFEVAVEIRDDSEAVAPVELREHSGAAGEMGAGGGQEARRHAIRGRRPAEPLGDPRRQARDRVAEGEVPRNRADERVVRGVEGAIEIVGRGLLLEEAPESLLPRDAVRVERPPEVEEQRAHPVSAHERIPPFASRPTSGSRRSEPRRQLCARMTRSPGTSQTSSRARLARA
jgi:hypothetical protein